MLCPDWLDPAQAFSPDPPVTDWGHGQASLRLKKLDLNSCFYSSFFGHQSRLKASHKALYFEYEATQPDPVRVMENSALECPAPPYWLVNISPSVNVTHDYDNNHFLSYRMQPISDLGNQFGGILPTFF